MIVLAKFDEVSNRRRIVACLVPGDLHLMVADGGGQPQETVSYTHYNVTELFDALKKNALSAEKTYNGQYVEIEGYLGTIDSGGKYICVEASSNSYDYLFDSVQCYIKRAEQTMEMSAGDPITVRGKITAVGEVLGYSLDIDSIDQAKKDAGRRPFFAKIGFSGNRQAGESVKKRVGQIKEIFISFLLPFCNHLYIMKEARNKPQDVAF